MLHGGGFNLNARFVRAANRNKNEPDNRNDNSGFRARVAHTLIAGRECHVVTAAWPRHSRGRGTTCRSLPGAYTIDPPPGRRRSEAAGFDSGYWSTLLIQELIRQRFGVLYNRFYIGELLHNLAYSYQKARFVSDHLDEARRQAWLQREWPQILQHAKERGALILFGDEASLPQWGTLSDTWARKGQPPTLKTSGKRKGYKVLGFIEYFNGRFFHQAVIRSRKP